MLIEFSVANFKSIKEEARLSLVASRNQEHWSTHVSQTRSSEGSPVLPRTLGAVVVYGPNAGGKTNLLMAIDAMQQIVTRSSMNIDEPLPVEPFLFDPRTRHEPTTFDATLLIEGVRYQYGFSATRSAVHEEWLYAWPRGRPQLWFHRQPDESGDFSVKFGNKLGGDKLVWHRATRRNALLLSTAASLNSSQLQPIWKWFSSKLHTAGGAWDSTFTLRYCDEVNKGAIVDFLRAAGLALDDIQITEESFSEDMLSDDLPKNHKDLLVKELQGTRVRKAQFAHAVENGDVVELDAEQESAGTQKMLALAGPWLDTFENGNTLVIDELEAHLHPSLVRFLVQKFHDPNLNCNGAQLIFSTHNTSILDQSLLRRDQIWFCERDRHRATVLSPLSDFRPRKRYENLERAYLAGRYGAVPNIRTLADSTAQPHVLHEGS